MFLHIALLVCVILIAIWAHVTFQKNTLNTNEKPKAPGPKPWPVFGSIHLFGKFETPLKAFTAMSKIYGDVFSITLGTSYCVVVNNFKLIKEVLITKGACFGGRPDFIRFHKLFGGDRNNSLALCDWSSLQKTRRSIARTYCSPRLTSIQYEHVNDVAMKGIDELLSQLQKFDVSKPCSLKPVILTACANMFTHYMCSTRFGFEDEDFNKMVLTFDEIFWEINQGYLIDFMPWLLPIYRGHMKKLSTWSSDIRRFILKRIINKRKNGLNSKCPPRDFTDALLLHLETDPNMNWHHIIFELEDFLGGHSAIGNLIMVILGEVVRDSKTQTRIQEEIDVVTQNTRNANLFDKDDMPYTEATIWETLRRACSPIVPHVATVDTEIGGFSIPKDTVVFVNNYTLNMGSDYWEDPSEFKPERFLSRTASDVVKVVKPAHFIPFSTGRRTCIGQKLVQCFTFVILANIFQRYHVKASDSLRVLPGCVAVPPDCFQLLLTPRYKD